MSYLNGVFQNKMVLVTGATGFIGGRLAQRLAGEEGAVVTGMGRNLEKASFLSEMGVQLQKADLKDAAGWGKYLSGQEIVFHVAAALGRHFGRDATIAYRDNVEATESLVRVAAESGVKRFVHVSSINAYGPPQRNLVDESHPVNVNQRDIYGRTKAIGELRARQLAKEAGLELVVVRPGMVYGPRSIGWSARMVELVQRGVPVIFGDGSGYAYPVFIDNLVDGMLLTAVHPQAAGQSFNFVDDPVTWKAFFDYYAAMCGTQPRQIPLWLARFLAYASEKFNLGLPLTRERLQFYILPATFPTTQAETLLGYKPRISIDEGMKQAEAWMRQAGYLDQTQTDNG